MTKQDSKSIIKDTIKTTVRLTKDMNDKIVKIQQKHGFLTKQECVRYILRTGMTAIERDE